MFVVKLLLIYYVSQQWKNTYGQRTCEDCIPYPDCEGALSALARCGQTAKTVELFISAHCGYKYSDGQKIPKVCCSDMTLDAIETHPNFRLLNHTCVEIEDETRIIGGTNVGIYEMPWMSLISYRTTEGLNFGCGGSILNSRYILTAAHCVQNKNIAGVRVGEHDIGTTRDCERDNLYYTVCEEHIQDLAVEKIKIHEHYFKSPSTKTVEHDIALIRLWRHINFSFRNVAPVCLPIAQELRKPLRDGERGYVAGWGSTETGTNSQVIMKVKVPLFTNNTCNRNYYNRRRKLVDAKVGVEFCAGEEGKDSCDGDSGGPFVIEREFRGVSSYIQYGIVSRGPKICGSNYPGIYTNVIEYIDWILNNIRD